MFSFESVLKRKEGGKKEATKTDDKPSSTTASKDSGKSEPSDSEVIPKPPAEDNVMFVEKKKVESIQRAPTGILPPSIGAKLSSSERDAEDYPLPEAGIQAPSLPPNQKQLAGIGAGTPKSKGEVPFAPPTVSAPKIDDNKTTTKKSGLFGNVMSQVTNAVADMVLGEEEKDDDIEDHLDRIELQCDTIGEALEALELGRDFDEQRKKKDNEKKEKDGESDSEDDDGSDEDDDLQITVLSDLSLGNRHLITKLLKEAEARLKTFQKYFADYTAALKNPYIVTQRQIQPLLFEKDKAEEALKESRLKMKKYYIGDEGIDQISNVLSWHRYLHKLKVHHCHITSTGAQALSRGLAINHILQELDLSHNKIGCIGLHAILKALHSNQSTALKVLKLHDCGLGDDGLILTSHYLDGASEYSKTTEYKQYSKRIELERQEEQGGRSLPMGENDDSSDPTNAPFQIPPPMTTTTLSLTEIDFRYNNITDKSVVILFNVLRFNDVMKTVLLCYNNLTELAGRAIADIFKPKDETIPPNRTLECVDLTLAGFDRFSITKNRDLMLTLRRKEIRGVWPNLENFDEDDDI
eukprot:g1398.t1